MTRLRYRDRRHHREPDVYEQHLAIGAYMKQRLEQGEARSTLAKRMGCTPEMVATFVGNYERSLRTFWPLAVNENVFNLLKEIT